MARGAQNYAIPHLTVESRLVRCNLPPRTIMRGPGTMQAVLLIEHVVDRVAAYLGVDPCLVRERNLLKHPKLEGAGPTLAIAVHPSCHGNAHQAPCSFKLK